MRLRPVSRPGKEEYRLPVIKAKLSAGLKLANPKGKTDGL